MEHRLYIPIMNHNCTPGTRGEFLSMLKDASCDTVFLAVEQEPFFRKEWREESFRNLRENVAFFAGAGFEVGIWARGFGFGTPVPDFADPEIRRMVRLRSVCGKEGEDAFCPTDDAYLVWYGDWFRQLCLCGAGRIMIDDDLCQSVRPGIGCFCRNHKALLAQELGLSVDAPELADEALQKSIFWGAPGRERAAYIKVTGDSLRRFCRYVRSVADSVSPKLRLGFCAGYTSFDSEGATAPELTGILAGSNRPFLRLSGAPYWNAPGLQRFPGTSMIDILEFVRMQRSFCPEDMELFHEADTWPRPRTMVPAAMCEAYDSALRTERGLGGLKYLFDYFATPGYETGYLKYHRRYRAFRERIDRCFAGTTPYGIRVIEGMHKMEWQTLPADFAGEKPLMRRALTRAGGFVATLGFPTVYGGDSGVAVCFGENARTLVGKPLPERLILDTPAALILRDAGVDVGLVGAERIPAPPMMRHGAEEAATGALPYAYALRVAEGARTITSFYDDRRGTSSPAVYGYRTGETAFLVYAFDGYAGDPRSPFSLSYFRAEEISEFVGYRFPLIRREPGVYQICGQGESGEKISLFMNLSTDTLFDFTICHAGEATVVGAGAEVCGDVIKVSDEIPPYQGFLLSWR